MAGYVLRRSLQALATLLVFITLVFFLVQAQPGDFSLFYIRSDIPRESRDAIAAAFGLNKPAWQQFVVYLSSVLQGDFGVSFTNYPRTVLSIIWERLPRTLLLFASATVISYYLGFLLGKEAAWRRGSLIDYAGSIGGVYVYTLFLPWFALLMVWLFAVQLGWLPAGKFISPELWTGASVDSNTVFLWLLLTVAIVSCVLSAVFALTRRSRAQSWALLATLLGASAGAVAVWTLSGIGHLAADILWHAVLPVAVLSVVSTAGVMLFTRHSMVNVLKEQYVLAATARGLPERTVKNRYAARNALLPVVTSFAFSLAFAIDGSVIIEGVFSWPGMGMTLIEASLAEDQPLAVGAFVFTGLFALAAHVAVDVLTLYLDPRQKRS